VLNKKMILVIEDNEDIRETLAELLTLEGFVVETADCGLYGLQLAREFKPDLIICDILMPGLDGYGVLLSLRQNKQTCDIPFIFSSSKAEKKDAQMGMALGAKYFFVKPFDELLLINCIKNCLFLANNRFVKQDHAVTARVEKS
jgi:CheY-like chemotaxis protein